jgi:hypothetical protein
VTITSEEVEQAKGTLPFGWGRFGKAIEHLAEISESGESLQAVCVGLNPGYKFRPDMVSGGLITAAGGPGATLTGVQALLDLKKTTNVVLACTNQRLIVLGTGGGGAPREHASIPLDGLRIVSRAKKEFVLGWPDGEMRIRGAAKQQVFGLLEAVESRARPASYD